MAYGNTEIREALRGVVTRDVDVNFHCRACKGFDSINIAATALAAARCRCGSRELMLLSVTPERTSPLIPAHLRADA